jgi:hypothetical protein
VANIFARGAMKQFLTDMLERSSGSITVRSQAMGPLTWFCGIMLPVGATGLAFGPASFAWVYVALIGIAVLLYAGFYTYWAVKDPDRLGSEAFVERSHVIRILEKSKDPEELLSAEAPAEIVTNPDPPTKTKALEQ